MENIRGKFQKNLSGTFFMRNHLKSEHFVNKKEKIAMRGEQVHGCTSPQNILGIGGLLLCSFVLTNTWLFYTHAHNLLVAHLDGLFCPYEQACRMLCCSVGK